MNAAFPSVFFRRLWRCRLLLVAVLVFHAATAATAGVEKTSEFVKGKSKCRFWLIYSLLNLFMYFLFTYYLSPQIKSCKEIQLIVLHVPIYYNIMFTTWIKLLFYSYIYVLCIKHFCAIIAPSLEHSGWFVRS